MTERRAEGSILDQVAERLDFDGFLSSLPEQHRRILLSLSEGRTQEEAARSLGTSDKMISWVRQRGLVSWLQFGRR